MTGSIKFCLARNYGSFPRINSIECPVVKPSTKSTWILFTIVTMQTIIAEPTEAQDRTQARSMVVSRGGIVATEHPLASQAGATILSQGGNAIDAAIAANAAMGVVAPMMWGT